MTVYEDAEEWQHYTNLLIRAYPTTTRITTKYTILPRPNATQLAAIRDRRSARLAARAAKRGTTSGTAKPIAPTENDSTPQPAREAKAVFELRTYDPSSGVVLKYRTDQAAMVGRLVAMLGRMGRTMGALPEEMGEENVLMEDAGEDGGAPAAAAVGKKDAPAAGQEGKTPTLQTQAGTSGSGKSKKKKGKR